MRNFHLKSRQKQWIHYIDIIMTTMVSQITSLTIQPFIQAQIKENIKAPRHWPLCVEFTGTGEFPAQMVNNAENVSIWWRHHELSTHLDTYSDLNDQRSEKGRERLKINLVYSSSRFTYQSRQSNKLSTYIIESSVTINYTACHIFVPIVHIQYIVGIYIHCN